MKRERNNNSKTRRTTWYPSLNGLSVLILLSIITKISAVTNETKAMLYLRRYGYINSPNKSSRIGRMMSQATIDSDALKKFQAFIGIKETGYLDEETMQMMSKPRCGVKDNIDNTKNHRRKRYALAGSRWEGENMTYKISKYSRKLPKSEIDQAVERAFGLWSEVTPLRFQRVMSGPCNIEIIFEELDGPGNKLAQAYYPLDGGNVQFDDTEYWTINIASDWSKDLFQVAVHEFGHSLGLAHSREISAVMFPLYRFNWDFSLHNDDIAGIQALYGPNMNSNKPPNQPPSTPNDDSNLYYCDEVDYDIVMWD